LSAANIQRIEVLPGDGQAVYKVLLAARALEGVMFNHDEWDEAMSAFGRISLIASAKGATDAGT
jgi:hypothetical protein